MNRVNKFIVPILAIGILSACGFGDGARTNRAAPPPDDRYLVREYRSDRAYNLSQGQVKAQNLATRLSNEAERVYNVAEAITIVEGHDIIMSIATKGDAYEPADEVVKKVRQRLMSKEPRLAGYNLYITTDQSLGTRISKAHNNMENFSTPGYPIDMTEPNFAQILGDVRASLLP
ncbi:YhcN/YlaJ family sporulation lipoprotein [Ammoniphilus sp. YIM 78166]|uniref:YhcN/YlaJ family sporulation lipoprotein n=1 Tax=Ammoniphilus sp. YIM 78166 TaxID=1644106 RepID=UPI00106F1AC1|nr:YhcN/YlaJ family sporulation lipoprotein [Ammoniphilus sp. YIM 78166]